jgi:hypothetical protein
VAASGVPQAAVESDSARRRLRTGVVPRRPRTRPRGPSAALPVALGRCGHDCFRSHAGIRGAWCSRCSRVIGPPPPPPTVALLATPSRLGVILQFRGFLEPCPSRATALDCRGESQCTRLQNKTLRIRHDSPFMRARVCLSGVCRSSMRNKTACQSSKA